MAVPSNPTVSSIVVDALKHVLTATPTAGQESELTNNGFQTVKTEIWAACTTDKLLQTSAMVALTKGSGQVALPADFDHEIKVEVYTCPESLYFTAAAATSSTMTAPSSFSADVTSLRGQYLFTLAGTGSSQVRQITDYDNTTKILTVTPTWTVTPDATTTAFVGTQRYELVKDDPASLSVQGHSPGIPRRYKILGTTPFNSAFPVLEISPVPNQVYFAMILTYGPNLTRLDESGSLFVKHLRERRALWFAGLVAMATSRHDEARFAERYQIFQKLLAQVSGHNTQFGQVRARR